VFQTPSSTMTVTVGPATTDSDIDELVSALDEVYVNAVVAPFPRRMGLPVEPLALAIEIPLGVLGTLFLEAAGRKVRNAIARVVDRHRRRSTPTDGGDLDRVVMTIYDQQRRVRLDITARALTDDRLWASLSQLTSIPDAGPVSLRWDRSSGSWRIESAADQ
jgi:hypothetical protein